MLVQGSPSHQPIALNLSSLDGASPSDLQTSMLALEEARRLEVEEIFHSASTEIGCIAETIAAKSKFLLNLQTPHSETNVLYLNLGGIPLFGELALAFQSSMPERNLIFIASQVTTVESLSALLRESKRKEQVIVISDGGAISEPKINTLLEILKNYLAENGLIVFIENAHNDEGREIARSQLSHFDIKEETSIGNAFVEALMREFEIGLELEGNYVCFPPQAEDVKYQLLNLEIERDKVHGMGSTKTFQRLIEYFTGIPLEKITIDQRQRILDALKRQFDSNGGAFLKRRHRIFFAIPDSSAPNIVNSFKSLFSGTIDLELKYARINQILSFGFVEEAGRVLSNALKHGYQEWETKTLQDESVSYLSDLQKGIMLLIDIKVKLKLHWEAVALLSYLSKLESKINQDSREIVYIEKMAAIEADFLSTEGASSAIIRTENVYCEELAKIRTWVKDNLQELDSIELDAEERAIAVNDILKETKSKIVNFISRIANGCIDAMEQSRGLPPCSFALMIMDDFLHPYSVINLTFLIEDEKHRPYFQALFDYIQIECIKLGETPVSDLKIEGLPWIYDDVTSRGFGVQELPSQTPTASSPSDRCLIYTPMQLAQKQYKGVKEGSEWHGGDFSTALNQMTVVTGLDEKELMDKYTSYCQTIFPTDEDLAQTPAGAGRAQTISQMQRYRAVSAMAEDLAFMPNFERNLFRLANQLEDDLILYVERMIKRLHEYYWPIKSHSEGDSLTVLDEEIGHTSKMQLQRLLACSRKLFLEFYIANGKRTVTIGNIGKRLNEIVSLYRLLIPFQQTMREFYSLIQKGEDPKKALTDAKINDDPSYVKGVVAYLYSTPSAANEALNMVIIKSADSLELHGKVKEMLADYSAALDLYRQAFDLNAERPLVQSQLLVNISVVLKKIGQLKEAGEALSQAQRLLEGKLKEKKAEHRSLSSQEPLVIAQPSLSTDGRLSDNSRLTDVPLIVIRREISTYQQMIEEVHREQAYLSLYCDNFTQVREHLDSAKMMANRRTASLPIDSNSGEKLDLSIARNNQLEAMLLSWERSQRQLAHEFAEKAKNIIKGIYRSSTHPTVLLSESIVHNYEDQPPITHEKQILLLQKKNFGTLHPITIEAYGRLTEICIKANEYKRAQDVAYNGELHALKFYGPRHPVLGEIKLRYGDICMRLGKLEDAFKFYSSALEIYESCFGDRHPDVARCLQKRGCAQTDYSSRLADQERAIAIFIEFFGDNHASIIAVLEEKIATLHQLGRIKEAFIDEETYLSFILRRFGDNRKTVSGFHSVAMRLSLFGHHNRALEFLARAFQIAAKINDRPMLKTLHSTFNIVASRQGEFSLALLHLESEISLRRMLHGPEDGKVLASVKEIPILQGIVAAKLGSNNKKFKEFYNQIWSLAKRYDAFTPEFACYFVYANLLSEAKKPREFTLFINKIEGLFTGQQMTFNGKPNQLMKLDSVDKGKVALALAQHFLKQRDFKKAFNYAAFIEAINPAILFTYRQIEVVGLEERDEMLGEQIPYKLLGKWLLLKIWIETGRAPMQLLRKNSEDLLAMIEATHYSGKKVENMRLLAQPYMTTGAPVGAPPPSSSSSSHAPNPPTIIKKQKGKGPRHRKRT